MTVSPSASRGAGQRHPEAPIRNRPAGPPRPFKETGQIREWEGGGATAPRPARHRGAANARRAGGKES